MTETASIQCATHASGIPIPEDEFPTYAEALDALEGEWPARGGVPSTGKDDFPIDLEVLAPRAISLRQLYAKAGREVPAEIECSLGPSEPLLFVHGVTPFYAPGISPVGVSALGYRATIVDEVESNTVDVEPRTEVLRVGQISQDLTIGIGADGRLSTAGLGEFVPVLDLGVPGASIGVQTSSSVSLAIRTSLSFLKIQAGPIAKGGARWNLFRQESRLDVAQLLVQTVLVPKGIDELRVESRAWVQTAGTWFGLRKGKVRHTEPLAFVVRLRQL